MSSQTDTLIASAVCIGECIPQGMQLPVLIAIFANIAGMSTNTNTLIAGAVCIDQCIPKGMQLPVLISLANQILLNGGTGGGGSGQVQIYTDNTAPGSIAPPANKQAAAIAYSALGTSPTYTWSVTNQQWQ